VRFKIFTVTLMLAATAMANPVKVTFLPPPIEGTISLGVYDNMGNLVRILNREANWSAFTAQDNGLLAQWDGKDDSGTVCPTGTYHIRGVVVGDLEVEGIDLIGNDWVTDENSPRISRIIGMLSVETGTLYIQGILPGSAPILPGILTNDAAPAYFTLLSPSTQEEHFRLQPYSPKTITINPEDLKTSSRSTLVSSWVVKDNSLHYYGKDRKLLYTLPVQPDDPSSVKFVASSPNEKLYVLYEDEHLQRLRGYDFAGVKPGGEPKLLFENDIIFSDRYEQIASHLKFPDDSPFTASAVLNLTLLPNPLLNNKPGKLLLRAIVDKDGASLATADGLPLCRISETKNIKWAVLGQPADSQALTFFNSDGAVVEQFQIAKPNQMMSFDAGAVQWKAPAPEKPKAP